MSYSASRYTVLYDRSSRETRRQVWRLVTGRFYCALRELIDSEASDAHITWMEARGARIDLIERVIDHLPDDPLLLRVACLERAMLPETEERYRKRHHQPELIISETQSVHRTPHAAFMADGTRAIVPSSLLEAWRSVLPECVLRGYVPTPRLLVRGENPLHFSLARLKNDSASNLIAHTLQEFQHTANKGLNLRARCDAIGELTLAHVLAEAAE